MSSAHACSEIGLKWFLFALHDLGTALGLVSVLHFFGYFVSSNTGETGKPELKPFLTILGTRTRAIGLSNLIYHYVVLIKETESKFGIILHLRLSSICLDYYWSDCGFFSVHCAGKTEDKSILGKKQNPRHFRNLVCCLLYHGFHNISFDTLKTRSRTNLYQFFNSVRLVDYFLFWKQSMQIATNFTSWSGCGKDVRPLVSMVT